MRPADPTHVALGLLGNHQRESLDGKGYPHLALTSLYHRLHQELSDGAARTYL